MEKKENQEEKSWMTIFIPENYSKEEIKNNPNKIVIDQLARVIASLEQRIINIEKILLGSDKIYPRALKIKWRKLK